MSTLLMIQTTSTLIIIVTKVEHSTFDNKDTTFNEKTTLQLIYLQSKPATSKTFVLSPSFSLTCN